MLTERANITLLLDVPLIGIRDFLHDLGWKNIDTVSNSLGQRASDDDVVKFAKEKGLVVVTPDKKLARRCNLLDVRCIQIGLEDYAIKVHETLIKQVQLE